MQDSLASTHPHPTSAPHLCLGHLFVLLLVVSLSIQACFIMAFFFLHSVFLFVCFWNTCICGIEADREVGWLTDKQNSHLLVYYLKLDTTTGAGLDQSWENSVLGLLGAAGTTYLDHSLLPPLVHIRRKAATVPGTQVQVPWLGIQTGCLYTWPNAYPKISFHFAFVFFYCPISISNLCSRKPTFLTAMGQY